METKTIHERPDFDVLQQAKNFGLVGSDASEDLVTNEVRQQIIDQYYLDYARKKNLVGDNATAVDLTNTIRQKVVQAIGGYFTIEGFVKKSH